jgi:ABC-type amino acid transport substrate-binding protein
MRRRQPFRATAVGALAGLAAVSLVGCGLTIPSDPDGTLDSVRGGELRVGVAPDGELVEVGDGDPTGSVIDLVDGFADTVDASPEWTVATEETLVRMLERGDLDLIAGGITSDTPWLERAGVSRGYTDIDGADGRTLVMLVPLGENAFLSELERYLDAEVGS